MPEGAADDAPIPLASALAGGPTAFVRADVALDGEPVIGSFTVDGMTFAVADGGTVELVGVSPGEGSDALAIPGSVSFEGSAYDVASIAPYAFYLSGVASVELPASVIQVDERAFRSSDVASVEVDPANLSYASHDGILYDASLSRLLLIPGGRMGAARISDKAEEVGARAFSHCAGVTAISVDAGSAFLSSWDGLLYDASGSTLLRVPAGATDITIRDGCTAIAAGAMEGCAQLSAITAPASVASVSPDVFTSVPTVSLPAASAVAGSTADSAQTDEADATGSASQQLSALVALSATDDDLPEVDPAGIVVCLDEGVDGQKWRVLGFPIKPSSEKGADCETQPEVSELWSSAGYQSYGYPTAVVHTAPGFPVQVYVTPDSNPVSAWNYVNANPGAAYTIPASSFYNVLSGAMRVDLCDNTKTVRITYADGGVATPSSPWYAHLKLGTGDWIGYVRSVYEAGGYTHGILKSTDHPGEIFGYNIMPNSIGTRVDLYFNAYQPQATFHANGGQLDGASTQVVTCAESAYVTTPTPTRANYTFAGWYANPTGGGKVCDGGASYRMLDPITLYAQWKINSYVVTWDANGGTVSPSSQSVDHGSSVVAPIPIGPAGVVFAGWHRTVGVGGPEALPGGASGVITSACTYAAQWEPAISADVPLEVTARVDVLGLEEQEEATGYIESRCGEPLTVASIELTPLAAATEIFGAANVADVALEVLAAGSVSPDARFALDASASQTPASAAAFRMASYGTRVPIGYRFAIPDALLPTLTEATKPVCSVTYTMALANPES